MKEIDQKVLTHWNENLLNAIEYCKTGDKQYKNKINISDKACAWCIKYGKINCYKCDKYCNKCSNCEGCPIFKMTKEKKCSGTNWSDIHYSLLDDDDAYELVKEIEEFYDFLKRIILI